MATKPRAPREPTPKADTPAEACAPTPETPAAPAEPDAPPAVVEDPAPSTHVTVAGHTRTRADAVLLGLIPPTRT